MGCKIESEEFDRLSKCRTVKQLKVQYSGHISIDIWGEIQSKTEKWPTAALELRSSGYGAKSWSTNNAPFLVRRSSLAASRRLIHVIHYLLSALLQETKTLSWDRERNARTEHKTLIGRLHISHFQRWQIRAQNVWYLIFSPDLGNLQAHRLALNTPIFQGVLLQLCPLPDLIQHL